MPQKGPLALLTLQGFSALDDRGSDFSSLGGSGFLESPQDAAKETNVLIGLLTLQIFRSQLRKLRFRALFAFEEVLVLSLLGMLCSIPLTRRTHI